jgi:tetratricopeptide (TPR) repeat protein
LTSPFDFDDLPNILNNPHIRLTELNPRDIITAAFKSHASTRPVANISFALNYFFHQYNVVGYHLVNIFIHILTAVFLYHLIKQTLLTPSLRERYSHYHWIPFFATALWFIHPIQTQAITYIVQRMTSLAAMFYILALLLYVKGRLAGILNKKSRSWFAGCIICCIFAFGCKQITLTLPVFIFLYEWYFFQDLSIAWLKRRLPYFAGVIVVIALLGIFYTGKNPLKMLSAPYAYLGFTMTERLMTQFRVVIYYISLLVFPHPARLNLDYDFLVSHSLIDPPTTLICLAIIVGFIVSAFYTARKKRLLSFCILWFFGNLVIESSVISLELVYEHRLYLPSMFVSLAVVSLFYRFVRQNWLKIAIFCFVTGFLCLWTYQRNRVWSDPVTLWQDCVSKSPNKARPHNNLGLILQLRGRIPEAVEHYHKALEIKPNFAEAHNNFALALKEQNKLDEAAEHLRDAFRLRPNYPEAHYNLASVLKAQGQLDEAINSYRRAIQLNPDIAQAHYDLAVVLQSQNKLDEALAHYRKALLLKHNPTGVHNNLGIILQSQGRLTEAITHFYSALQLMPYYPKAHNNLAYIFQSQGRFYEAIFHYQQALQTDPNFIKAHRNIADVLRLQGRFSEAIGHYQNVLRKFPEDADVNYHLALILASQEKFDEALIHYRQTLQTSPDQPLVLNDIAWILATHPDPNTRDAPKAISFAERAAELTKHQNPTILDTLAAAYAAAGRFEKAVKTAQKALDLAEAQQNSQLADSIRKQLERYKQTKN